ncbi:MAG: alpha/beta hydrolase [Myxococcota bacterium]
MKQRGYDPDFHPVLPLLPGVSDELADPSRIGEFRGRLMEFVPPAPPRDDILQEDRRVPGPEGAPDVPVRIYRPSVSSGEPTAGLFEIHGGGFITGSIEMMDAWCQQAVEQLGVVVVSVEYRLAPEHPFPAAPEDCYAALGWMSRSAGDLGIDPERIAVVGQSAGGGLAAATALLARDRGGPAIRLQVLEIPELDDRLDTPSMHEFDDTPLWNRPNAVWSWRHYLGADHDGEVSPYAAPARARDLAGLPPAYVSTMEFDPLRDEGIQYALRMLQAGVSVELHSFPGTFHGSSLLPTADVSRRGSAELWHVLGRHLGAGS